MTARPSYPSVRDSVEAKAQVEVKRTASGKISSLMNFNDRFGGVALGYANHRPTYPDEMFAWLAQQCSATDVAWDCGAGSGQATVSLAEHFRRVLATDASAAQLAQAPVHAQIDWRVAPAEESGLPASCADAVVVAQALHWFDLERFHAEVRRVLKPSGVIAVWSYGVSTIDGEGIDEIVGVFYREVVGPYWPRERRHVETGYRDLPFPFTTIAAPAFTMQARWSLDALMGYFGSWSATAAFVKARGFDPIDELRHELQTVWGPAAQTRSVRWPLSLRAGRV